MKRVVAVVVAAVMVATVAGLEGASASPSTALAAAYVPDLEWNACGEGDQCADFVVPLDHAQPDGEKITLAVRRRPHTTAGPAKGVMLTNPGGPGASGTGLVVLSDFVPGGVGHQYDWIGFDPRGVGESSPALRCDAGYFGVDRPSFVPRTKKLMRFWRTKTARYAARCGASAARKLLPHMTTLDTVRDMELLRVALGASKINFYGFSYGTYLGQVYATQYPTRVNQFVLDGNVDPATYWYRSNLRQEVGFDRNLNRFFRWVARHPGAYRLGRDWRTIRRGYDTLLRTLDRRPAHHGKLGPDELTDAILTATYYVFDWDAVAMAYSRLARRHSGGQMFGIYRNNNMGDDNAYAVYLGVQCSDVLRPTWRKQVRDARRIHRDRPFLAWDNTWYNAPCVSWPAPSRTRLAVSGAAAASNGAKFLLINETRDAATPYSGALRVRSIFPSSALVAGVGGTTHSGSLSGVACVDRTIRDFLNTGALPARRVGSRADRLCPKVSPPPATIGGRVASGSGIPPALRAGLFAGQLGGR
ncbi:MAG TPA: alpha/beta fold hydrolase [Marmoricola sp.]